MSCSWRYLTSGTAPERSCCKPGHPYCPEHQREIDAMQQADKDWDEILATHEAVCLQGGRKKKRHHARYATIAQFTPITSTAKNAVRMTP